MLKYAETAYLISTKRPSSFVHTRNDFKVIKELLAKGAVVESLDLKEAPDILAQAGLTTLALTIPDQYTVYGIPICVFNGDSVNFCCAEIVNAYEDTKIRCSRRKSLGDLPRSSWMLQILPRSVPQVIEYVFLHSFIESFIGFFVCSFVHPFRLFIPEIVESLVSGAFIAACSR